MAASTENVMAEKFRYEVRKFMQKAAKKGRRGADGVKDDRLVHVNAAEERLLKAAGGAGTINPATGLREYKYGGAGVTEGMNSKEGTFSGGGLGGGGSGQGSAGGMPKSLLDSKYPGSSRKKNRQYEANAANLAKVGTIMGSLLGGPAATAAKIGIDAISGDLDMESMLDPFSGRLPDTPSVGAGFADSGRKDDTVTGLTASRKKKSPRPTNPLGSIGTILSMAGGSIRAGGL
jgi:hypothetical protein